MFEDLRAAFREALENFNRELRRDQVPETVDRLLSGMRKEIVAEKAEVAGLEQQLEKTQAEIVREQENGETCRRRERMARDIGDQETADIAARQAVKHESRHAVLVKKAQALGEELELRRGTVREMMERFEEARSRRDALGATAGRTEARRTFQEADDLFAELDRMAEKVEGERARGDAAEMLDALDDDGASDLRISLDEEPSRPNDAELDAALAELKRRMANRRTEP
ncbi:MAG TPA: hypothetical protein VFQ22_07565 [Longimicrobiales bacterium]|nr:hypothetical protein [Longimicrobiales bacterium]